MTMAKATGDALSVLAREREKIETRISAYERGEFDQPFESPNPIGAQSACETLIDAAKQPNATANPATEEHDDRTCAQTICLPAEIIQKLEAESTMLDALEDRFDNLEDVIEKKMAELTERRNEIVAEHNAKRKEYNRGNMSKGFWPLYGGIFLSVIAVFATRDLGFGMPGALATGVIGYAAGFYAFKVLASRFIRTNPAADAAAKERLECLRAEHDRVVENLDTLKMCLAQIERDEENIDELQMHIQDALDDLDDPDSLDDLDDLDDPDDPENRED